MTHDDRIERARHEAEGQGVDLAEFVRLVAWEHEARELLGRARGFIASAVMENVRIPGFNPASHVLVGAIDEVLAKGGRS